MTIFEFLELSAGQWFTHRTSHYVSSNEQNGLKSNLSVELLDPAHADVLQLCQTYNVKADNLYAAQISWESLPEPKVNKQSGSDLLVFVPDTDNPATGAVYRKKSNAASHSGRYTLNAEERLTLSQVGDDLQVEEHLWFESPNVRLRHSIIHQNGAAQVISFASEIRRMGVTPPSS